MKISNLLFSPDQTYLLALNDKGSIYLWLFSELTISLLKNDYDGPKMFNYLCRFSLPNQRITSILISSKPKPALICLTDSELLSIEWGKILKKAEEIKAQTSLAPMDCDLTSEISTIIFKPDINDKLVTMSLNERENELAIGTENGRIYIFHLDSLKETINFETPTPESLELKTNSIAALVYKKNTPNQIVVGKQNGVISIWDSRTGALIETLKEKGQCVFSKVNDLKIEDPADQWLICAHDDYISKWNLNMASLSFVVETKSPAHCLSLTKDYFLSGHDDEMVTKWSLDGAYLNQTRTNSRALASIILEADNKSSLMLSSGCGCFVDVFYNNYSLFQLVAL